MTRNDWIVFVIAVVGMCVFGALMVGPLGAPLVGGAFVVGATFGIGRRGSS